MQSGCVSTIIPVFNRPLMFCQAVESVLAQTYRPIEIIIVDDGSTDSTGARALSLAASWPSTIRVLQTSNRGPGLARETGRRVAQGEFIQYLDSDDLLSPGKFEVQVAALGKNPDCGIAYGYTRLIDENGGVLAAPYKWTGRTMPTLFPALLVDRWWSTHTPLFRRSVCDAVGAWSDMRMSEDWEYEARVGALGTRLVHCPEFLSDHRCHSGNRLTARQPDRQTFKEMTSLIQSLYVCANRAGVSPDLDEMKHFSRWAFSMARQADSVGLHREAKRCLAISRTTGSQGLLAGLQLTAYGAMTATLGGNRSTRLVSLFERLTGWGAGSSTMRQSWMEQKS